QARFEQKFLLERIADLHGRTVFTRLLSQLARSKRGSGQAIASRLCANVKYWIANTTCSAARQVLMTQHTETKNIYHRIPLETLVKIDFTADCRNTDAIPVMCDSGHDAGKQPRVSA